MPCLAFVWLCDRGSEERFPSRPSARYARALLGGRSKGRRDLPWSVGQPSSTYRLTFCKHNLSSGEYKAKWGYNRTTPLERLITRRKKRRNAIAMKLGSLTPRYAHKKATKAGWGSRISPTVQKGGLKPPKLHPNLGSQRRRLDWLLSPKRKRLIRNDAIRKL